MAKPAKAAAAKTDYDGKKIDGYLRKILAEHDEIDSIKGRNAKQCQTRQTAIAGVIEQAKAAGVPPRIMKLQVNIELGKRRIRKQMEKLEREDQIEARLVAEARKDNTQMSLFGWTKENRPTKETIKKARTKIEGKVVSITPKADKPAKADGSELTANGAPPIGKTGDELKGDEFQTLN